MGVISGISGLVDGRSAVREWKIREIQRSAAWVDSITRAGVARACGIKDWRGYFLGTGHTPVTFPGQTLTFTGSVDGTLGVSGPAICDRIVVTWDIETGEVITYRVDFSGNGTFSKGAAAATDTATPVFKCSTGMYVAIDGSRQTDIRYMRLVIIAANRPYVSSDTAGQVNRTPGNIDAACTYRLYQDTPANLSALATPGILRFYVTASTYWELKWMVLEEIDDYGADREGAENVGATIKGAFSAYVGTTVGTIISPSTTQKWPTFSAEP